MGKNVYENILDVVGNTPMVKLGKIIAGNGIDIFAKLEFMNPMGSVKDRAAKYMIEKAEEDGRIKDGQLIIENSSGNTALGLALVAIQKGYRLKVVVRDRISVEKINQLEALGVDVHKVDSSLPPEDPESYNRITPKMVSEIPDCYFPDQHNNRENNDSHYNSTGPEIWEQMDGKIDYFIAGIGTGGTVGGVAKYLKEKDPDIKVIAIDPEGSIFYDYFKTGKITESAPYLIEGLGDEFLIECADFSNVDDMYRVSDKDSFHSARRLMKEEGILGGGSSGAALWGALKLAGSLTGPARIVTIFPDGAGRYLSTIFNDTWMKEKGLL
ncbi:MAG: cysteine synthase family protein [Acidobacteriota bacterium]